MDQSNSEDIGTDTRPTKKRRYFCESGVHEDPPQIGRGRVLCDSCWRRMKDNDMPGFRD